MSNTGPSPTPRSSGSPDQAEVSAVFRDPDAVIRAVDRLAEKSVPADSVRVFVDDGRGGRREIPVEDESGALRGALIGAAVGATVGLGIAIAGALGLYGPTEVEVLSFRGVAGALRAILGGAAAAVPLGALLGLGYWQGRKKISKDDFRSGTATVVVESDELSELSRQVLQETGGDLRQASRTSTEAEPSR